MYSQADKQAALQALRQSAEANRGAPRWREVARSLKVAEDSLRRWWRADGGAVTVSVIEVAPPPSPPEAEWPGSAFGGPPTPPDPTCCTDLEYWWWRWQQVTYELASCRSDIGRVHLLKSQDEIRVHIRNAQERERETRGMSEEEVLAELRRVALELPPAHALEIASVFRQRHLI